MSNEKIVEQPAVAPNWYDLLEQAVQEPGELAAAHRFFRQYSLSNRWLASVQLRRQGLPLTPINTFKGWLAAKRPVQKGEKASVSLIMPVPIRKKKEDEDEETVVFTKFMPKRAWFHLGQTDGEEYFVEEKTQDWSLEAAVELLELSEVAFEFCDVADTRLGHTQGHAFAVSPLDPFPTYGRLREMARIVLGHNEEKPSKHMPLEPELRTVEAQTVAYLVAATLGFSGLDAARGELQTLLADKSRIPPLLANRAFAAADKILNAGLC